MGRLKEVQKRAQQMLKKATDEELIFDIALSKLTLGLVLMFQDPAETSSKLIEAAQFLDQAVANLREAEYQDWLAYGLIVRTKLSRLQKQTLDAWNYLEDAREIAERLIEMADKIDAELLKD